MNFASEAPRNEADAASRNNKDMKGTPNSIKSLLPNMFEGLGATNGLGSFFGGSNKKQRSQGLLGNFNIVQRDRAQSSNL